MIVSRTTVRALRAGEQPADPMDGLDPDERAAMLQSLAGGSPLPVAGGLPGGEERKISGRAPPLSAQARTGRPSLLGDR